MTAQRFQTKTARPTATVVKITPEMAEEWLGKNSHNRTLRTPQVNRLAGIIERGEWLLNGDAIRFSKADELLDGQHRLWAIVEAEKPVESLVITGLDPLAQETMDLGTKRNLGDALRIRGESDAPKIAAMLNYWWRYENGLVQTTMKPTIHQALELFDSDPDLWRNTKRLVDPLVKRFHLSTGVAGAVMLEFNDIDSEGAAEFFDRLITGVGLDEGSPILALRRYLELHNATATGTSANAVMHHALFIKAWNAYRQGRKIDKVMWKTTGRRVEAFPEAV